MMNPLKMLNLQHFKGLFAFKKQLLCYSQKLSHEYEDDVHISKFGKKWLTICLKNEAFTIPNYSIIDLVV